MNTHQKIMLNMRTFYFFTFFAFGGLFPLLSVYLQNDVGLSGSQIGTIMSIGPIVMLLSQPIWGILSDYTRQARKLLTIAVIATGLVGLLYVLGEGYLTLLFIAGGLALFQSAVVPLSDSLAMNYVREKKIDYGRVRLWGAAGFALSVWIMGNLSEQLGLSIIFYGFALSLFISGIFAWGMPKDSTVLRVEIKNGLGQLMRIPRFNIFLFVTFLVFGPILANNFYFGLLIQFSGGSLAGVGFAYLLAAGSEIPFMRWAGTMINKLGILKVLFLASFASALRWLFYATDPAPVFIYGTTIIQGLSIGLFIPAALQYVSQLAPTEIKATAISIYSAVGNGLGAWFFTFMAGLLMDIQNILLVYLFYGLLTLIGAGLVLIIIKKERSLKIEDTF